MEVQSDPNTITVSAMQLILQRLEVVQDEVQQLMQIHDRLTQEVQEATGQLRNILASTQTLPEQRSLQR